MKKIIYTLMLCLPILAFSQYEKNKEVLDISVEWNGRHCSGSVGLCDITINNGNKTTDKSIKAIYNSDNSTLLFIINKNSLSKDNELKILGKQSEAVTSKETLFYTLDYDFELSTNLIDSLNLEYNLNTISEGNYPIEITEDTITITFNLK